MEQFLPQIHHKFFIMVQTYNIFGKLLNEAFNEIKPVDIECTIKLLKSSTITTLSKQILIDFVLEYYLLQEKSQYSPRYLYFFKE